MGEGVVDANLRVHHNTLRGITGRVQARRFPHSWRDHILPERVWVVNASTNALSSLSVTQGKEFQRVAVSTSCWNPSAESTNWDFSPYHVKVSPR
eukprot:2342975-Amphidinium_carterae.1